MRNYEEAKKILKKDVTGLSLVSRKLQKEIDNDIEECLKRQQKEIDSIVDDLNNIAKSRFQSISEFQIFVLKNIKIESAF